MKGVAILLKCSTQKVQDLIEKGELIPNRKFGKNNLFDKEQIIRYKNLKKESDSHFALNHEVIKISEGDPLLKNQNFQSQKERVYLSFSQYPKTMLMVAIETGIYRANICRIVAELRKEKRIEVSRNQLCKVSGYRAGFLTTNPDLFSKVEQLNLFQL